MVKMNCKTMTWRPPEGRDTHVSHGTWFLRIPDMMLENSPDPYQMRQLIDKWAHRAGCNSLQPAEKWTVVK